LFAGADAFLPKPFEMTELLTTITTFVKSEKLRWS
jgi:DNA-binding response OmpR family regulator